MLEPDMIKIDKRCVIGISSDPALVENLRRYTRIARTLGCEIVAEGIETAGDLRVVRDLGIEFGQGYFWGKPV
jgi:EAL domain-containing protein (putative c-di-GMP-specific phosphodiesterase class I)